MRKLGLILICLTGLVSCQADLVSSSSTSVESSLESNDASSSGEPEVNNMTLQIDNKNISVTWEDNVSTKDIADYLKNGDITVNMSRYGGFEQVGSLPKTFDSEDTYLNSVSGDIVLYSSRSLVIFFGTNSWSYTKLGHIDNLSSDELNSTLNLKSVTAVLSLK